MEITNRFAYLARGAWQPRTRRQDFSSSLLSRSKVAFSALECYCTYQINNHPTKSREQEWAKMDGVANHVANLLTKDLK
jgi:hypothetical protein